MPADNLFMVPAPRAKPQRRPARASKPSGATQAEPCPFGLALLVYVLLCAVIVATAIHLASATRPHRVRPTGPISESGP